MTRIRIRLSVLAALLLVAGAVPGPASAHPYHLQVSSEVVTSPERLDADNWGAQSFLVGSDFTLSRVSLYGADMGTSDALYVSVRANALSAPASANLTSGTADGPPALTWLDIDVSPRIVLQAGQTYWIVAHSLESGGLGYDWWTSGNDLAYPDGAGADSSDGVLWSPRGRDFAFRVYGFLQPSLALDASASDSLVDRGQSVVFTVDVSNAGPGTAVALWANVTLPAELAYVSDDAGSHGGVLTGTYSFAFADIPPGAWSFNLTASVGAGVANGTSFTTRISLEGTDHNGVTTVRVVRNLVLTVSGVPEGPGGPAAGFPWWWLLPALAAAIGIGAFVAWRRRASTVAVEDVFVADRAGVLLAHRSTSIVPYQDEDVLIGMFKVIQDFVKDAFSRGQAEEMRAMEFGDRKILIEQGQEHFVAVVYRGVDRGELADRLRWVSREIDARFANVIAHWDGSVDTVRDITLLLPQVWKGRPSRKLPPAPPGRSR